jgi:hypothetical protein
LLDRTDSSGFERFGVGVVVEVNSRANPHHGERGQVDLLLSGEQQVSVILENIAHSVRFDPQELKAIALSTTAVSLPSWRLSQNRYRPCGIN